MIYRGLIMTFLRRFFDGSSAFSNFEKYETAHIFVFYVLAAAVMLMIIFKDKITPKMDRTIKVGATALAMASELGWHIWNYLNNDDFVGHLIYLDLCAITLILAFVFNLSRKSSTVRKVFPLIYFWSFGALTAILFPELSYGPDKFRFYHFFWVHSYIVLTALYGAIVDKHRIDIKDYWKMLKTLISMGIVVGTVDRLFDKNYMFLSGPAEIATPLDYLGDGSVYYLNLLLLSAFFLFLIYLPYWLKDVADRRAVARMMFAEEEWV
ncbi:membrane protein [Clostridia bacterium]|nr:membrane protein [Clostridia bacterium]